MTRKIYPYSLDSKDAKIAGVCSTLGKMFGIDPTFIRIAWVAVPLFTPIDFTTAIIAYAIVGIILAVQKRRAMTGDRRMSDFDRMEEVSKRKPTVHAMRTELDETDRRLMAIDHHINTQNDELAREIEKLPARGGEVMDILSLGMLSTSIILGLGAAGWAGLKAWNGWLDLKRFELTHELGRPNASTGDRPDRAGRPSRAGPKA